MTSTPNRKRRGLMAVVIFGCAASMNVISSRFWVSKPGQNDPERSIARNLENSDNAGNCGNWKKFHGDPTLTNVIVEAALGWREYPPLWLRESCPEVLHHFELFPLLRDRHSALPTVGTTEYYAKGVCTIKLLQTAIGTRNDLVLGKKTSLGALISGAPLPWDDVFDVLLPKQKIQSLLQNCKDTGGIPLKCVQVSNEMVQVYVQDPHADGRKTPVVRVRPLQEPVPSTEYYFAGLPLPVQGNSEADAANFLQVSGCVMGGTNRNTTELDCCRLAQRFPFRDNDGTLRVGDSLIYRPNLEQLRLAQDQVRYRSDPPTQLDPEPKSEPESEPQAVPEPQAKPDPEPQYQGTLEPEPKNEPEPQTLPNSEPQPTSVPQNQMEPRPHPHAGARFANGDWGLVADVTKSKQLLQERGEEKVMQAICNTTTERMPPFTNTTTDLIKDFQIMNNDPSDNPRVLCAVYTYAKAHERIQAIMETWGSKCDGFFAASTETVEDPNQLGYGAAIDLPHLGNESYSNMWQKTRSIVAYMYDNYRDDYDYFYVAGDDTHLVVENLKHALVQMGATTTYKNDPLYLGGEIRTSRTPYAHGGGGYVLNRKTLDILFPDNFRHCDATSQVSAEDRFMGRCLNRFGIQLNNTVDESGAQLMHFVALQNIVNYKRDPGNRYMNPIVDYWTGQYGQKEGLDLVSNRSISFHHVRGGEAMKLHHAMLYKSCSKGTLVGDKLSAVLSVA